MTSEDAKYIAELGQALLRLSNTYWHAGKNHHGPGPDPSFSPNDVESAWAQARKALKILTTEWAIVQMDVLHEAIGIAEKERREDERS